MKIGRIIFKIFQLTRSRGAWHCRSCRYCLGVCISTHTLTWSVTHSKIFWFPPIQFQLTRSRGAWPTTTGAGSARGHFNSHAHVERDRLNVAAALVEERFQLTRSRGAWLWVTAWARHELFISTHTLTWSVTLPQIPIISHHMISTHTLTWSVTRCICMMNEFYAFQLTRSRGAWRRRNC